MDIGTANNMSIRSAMIFPIFSISPYIRVKYIRYSKYCIPITHNVIVINTVQIDSKMILTIDICFDIGLNSSELTRLISNTMNRIDTSMINIDNNITVMNLPPVLCDTVHHVHILTLLFQHTEIYQSDQMF